MKTNLAPQVLDDPDDAKVEAPHIDVKSNLAPPILDNPSDYAKVEVPRPPVYNPCNNVKADVPPLVMNHFIDHQIHFNSERKFTSQDDLLTWVRYEVRKLRFTVVEKSNNG